MFEHYVNCTPNDNSEQEVPVPELANIELEELLLPGPVEGPSCTILKRKKENSEYSHDKMRKKSKIYHV